MTVLDVSPIGYASAARTLGADIAGSVQTTADRLLAALSSRYGMAGTDDVGTSWAAAYDAGAEAAVSAFTDLINASYGVAALLEQTGINYAGAEAASIPGETAPQSEARWVSSSAAPLHNPPSAAGIGVPEPGGWSLLQHLIGRLWPNGHQDLLRHAADAWHSAAVPLHAALFDLDGAISQVREQRAPEVDDAVSVLRGLRRQVVSLADNCAALGEACSSYAHQLDRAHSEILRECADFINTTIAAEAAGGLFAVFTAGLSEVAAQGTVAIAAARAAEAIKAVLSVLTTEAVAIAAELDATAIRLEAVSRELVPLLSRRVQVAEIVRPGVVGQLSHRMESAADLPLARLDAYASTRRAGIAGHAHIHQFPGIARSKSQFFDGVDLFRLTDTQGIAGQVKPNGRVVYVLHAPHAVGIDRTTGLETNVYTVVRSADGEVVTMYPGSSAKS